MSGYLEQVVYPRCYIPTLVTWCVAIGKSPTWNLRKYKLNRDSNAMKSSEWWGTIGKVLDGMLSKPFAPDSCMGGREPTHLGIFPRRGYGRKKLVQRCHGFLWLLTYSNLFVQIACLIYWAADNNDILRCFAVSSTLNSLICHNA